MKTIEVDNEVYEMLGNISNPFIETTPNMVLRRILGIDTNDWNNYKEESEEQGQEIKIEQNVQFEKWEFLQIHIENKISQLRTESEFVHSAFLTFLIDKYFFTHGNFTVSAIIQFMKSFNLRLPSGVFRNPWMKEPYSGKKKVW